MVRWPLFIVLSLLAGCAMRSDDPVVARVEGEKVRVSELQERLKPEAASYDPEILAQGEAVLAIKRRILQAMIDERVLMKIAEREKIEVSSREIRESIEKMKSGYGDREFSETVRRQGLTVREWETRQERTLTMQRLIEELLKRETPSEAEIQKEYRSQTSISTVPERVHCRQIVTTTRAKAEKILALLEKGENFAAMAQQYSESPDREKGGDLGFIARGELPPMMDEACFRFQPGQTSGIVRSSYGFHIFRILERRPARKLTLAEASPALVKSWRERHREEILDRVLRREEAKIEIDEELLKKTEWP